MKKSEQNIPLPLPENENERLNALVEYNILDTISQEQFDRLTKLASIICETPIALISLIDKDRQWFKSSIGLDIKETSREVSFCQYTIIGNQQFEVFDAKNDIRFAQNPLVTGKPDIRFYAGYPLIDPKGYALGTLCVIDTVPKVLTLNQSLALKTLAEDIMLQIESVKKNEDKRKFEKLFSISIDLISILGTDGFFKKINPAFSNLFGWTNEELLKKQYWDFFHPDDVEKTKVEFEKMSGGIKTSTCLNRFLDSKGNFIWIQWKFNLDEETKDFYAIGRDISKEMVNDKVLKDAKIEADRLRNVQEEKSKQLNEAQRIAHVGSWQWDIETGKEVWSDEQFRIFGFEPGESEATYELFSKCLHSEDHDKVMQDVAKAIEEKKDFNSEYRIVTKNGAIRNIEARAETIVNPEGKVVKMRGTVRDVTEKKIAEDKIKESQDRFFRIFEKNPVAMSLSNLETSKLEFVNDVFLNSLNYNRDEIIGKTSEELNIMTPEERERIISKLSSKGAVRSEAGMVTKKNGEQLWVLMSLEIIEINGKKYILSSLHDIAQLKEVEKNLELAKAHAEESNKLKDVFLSNMSHEIRTPLNSIVGFTSLLKNSALSKDQVEYVSNINTASENLLSILNDILDFSKMESGMITIENTIVDLPDLLDSVFAIAKGLSHKKRIEVSLEIDPKLPLFVVSDPTRVSQILINLVSNAIKFTERGAVTIRAIVSRSETEKCMIKFSVLDTGIGIEKANQESIFERFKQQYSSTTRKYGGTGLGLSIVKNLVGLLGGEIFVESEAGKGSDFFVFLPFTLCNKNEVELYLNERNDSVIITENQSERLKILLVEDNRMNQRYGRILLNEMGHDCSIAINGLQALDKVKSEKFDLILMDIQMPVMDGYEATEFIRKQLQLSTPIIAITANALAGEQRKCLNAGMNGYLSKPFSPEKLQKTIYEVKTNRSGLANGNLPIKRNLSSSGKDKMLDIQFLFSQVNGKAEGVIELIEIFKADNPIALEDLKIAILKEDYDTISKLAHGLVSSFSILGIQSAIEILKSIEINSDSLKQIEEIGFLFRKFEQICLTLENEMIDLIITKDSGLAY